MKKKFPIQYILYGLFLIGGLILGRLFFHSPATTEADHSPTSNEVRTQVWTCSMHPQIRRNEPGKCPICAMELIPVNQPGQTNVDQTAIHFNPEAAQLANLMISKVTREAAIKEIRMFGKVQADERLIQSQVAYFPGRVEKLFVSYTGETVSRGQVLATIYSPELITAQQELLEARRTKEAQPEIFEAAKEKLRQWKLTDNQIDKILRSELVQTNLDVVSTSSGMVKSRKVNTGDYISQGMVLYEIADLSQVWLLFDAYENDLPFLKKGDKLSFTIEAIPGTDYSGTISFIDPVIDPSTRVTRVRVELGNTDGKLKPEMFATGIVNANFGKHQEELVIPRSAVLWTGKRSVVYVKQPGTDPLFKLREIELGPVLGNTYVVTGGLSEGEEIVTEGAFSVDAAAQLEGKASMMNDQESRNSEIGSNHVEKDRNSKIAYKGKLEEKKIKVSGNCDMCKSRIETITKTVHGVISANWSIDAKILTVQFDPSMTSSDFVQQKIAEAGHDTEKYHATDEAYNKLPECCLYRTIMKN